MPTLVQLVVPRNAALAGSKLQRKVEELLRLLYAQGQIVGSQVAVYHKGRLVVDACAGTLGETDPRPVQNNTLFNVFSVSKAIAAVSLQLLFDRHLARPSDRVSQHWPDFAQNVR
jgi:CubicO group peptidase (beta-lactamase class C family)